MCNRSTSAIPLPSGGAMPPAVAGDPTRTSGSSIQPTKLSVSGSPSRWGRPRTRRRYRADPGQAAGRRGGAPLLRAARLATFLSSPLAGPTTLSAAIDP